MAQRDGGSRTKSPGEFVRDMPEGESAGPGAPETVEPTTGRPAAVPDAKGAAGFVAYVTQLGLGLLMLLRGARGDRT
jgi:hypothetical protein